MRGKNSVAAIISKLLFEEFSRFGARLGRFAPFAK